MPFITYSGADFYRIADTFMTACRERNPLAGLTCTGTLHWGWPDDAFDQPSNQRFWQGHSGPLGMLILSERHATFGYQILPGCEARPEALALLAEGLAWLERFEFINPLLRPSFYLSDPSDALVSMVQDAGFKETGEGRVQYYQNLKTLPSIPRVPKSYEVRAFKRADLRQGRPPLLDLSTMSFKEVRQTPTYDVQLHLIVESNTGEVAAEGFCWCDDAQAVAMFEPPIIAKAHARRGLARDLVVTGLQHLGQRGIYDIKVSHDKHHYALARLYKSLGFDYHVERKLFAKRY